MAISHATSARNALANTIDDQVNAGTTDAQGDFVVIESSGPTDLIEFNLQDPAFGSASSGQITLAGTPISTTASTSGTADKFEVRDKDNAMVYDGTVTATGGGGDVQIDNTDVASGQSAELSSHAYTAST